jgi:protein-S-isoprenylcysteine O-methyltransferase Ste14
VHLTAVSPLSMSLVGIGVALSMWAASTLGFERTYFAVELGLVPPSRVGSGPYGLVPHPMITGAVIALLGAHISPGLAEAWPRLVPGHVALYLVHLAQEVRLARATRTVRAG